MLETSKALSTRNRVLERSFYSDNLKDIMNNQQETYIKGS